MLLTFQHVKRRVETSHQPDQMKLCSGPGACGKDLERVGRGVTQWDGVGVAILEKHKNIFIKKNVTTPKRQKI